MEKKETKKTTAGTAEKADKPIEMNLKKGDKIILVSPMVQTVIAVFERESESHYYVKNPLLFASFPERDKDNPNIIRTRLQAPNVWNRTVMADADVDQYVAFPKSLYGIMFVNEETNNVLFSTDVNRVYESAWGKQKG